MTEWRRGYRPPLDSLGRPLISEGEGEVHGRYAHHWYYYPCKNGTRGRRIEFSLPCTELRKCERCSFLSTPKKVSLRYDVATLESHLSGTYVKAKMLCMGCWNKYRPLVKCMKDHRETKYLIYRLNKERLNASKANKEHGRTAPVSV